MATPVFRTSTCNSATSDTFAGCLSVTSPLQIYNYELDIARMEADPEAICSNIDATMQWKRNVTEDFINCCGANHMDSNFFMEMFGGEAKQIDSTNQYQRYRSWEDENVITKTAGLNVAGNTQRFQLSASSHNNNGTGSALFEGEMLYNYRNGQMTKITLINKTVPNAFIVTVIATASATENVDIEAGDKFALIPAVAVGGYSCPVGETTMNTQFTVKGINKFRLWKSWCMYKEVDKPYNDLMLFQPWIDKNGKTSQKALPIVKMRAMEEITQAANVLMFVGSAMNNANLGIDTWVGGEGMIPALQGAGKQWDYDPTVGFSLINDFKQIILEEDGKKKTTEWSLLGSLNFLASMTQRFTDDTKFEILPLTFGTLDRDKQRKEITEKYDVQAFKYLGRSIYFKEFSQLNVSNGIGNGIFPNLGLMIAMNGLQNNRGENIPALEYFRAESEKFGAWQQMSEIDRNLELITGCEKWEGDLKKTVLWRFNCPDQHRLLYPTYCA